MLFNSIFFLFVFFPIVTAAYYLLPHRFRWAWLLLASCYFYMGFIPKYILILAFTITIDYFSGLFIEGLRGHKKKIFLILSILSNIGVLFVFKYFNFFNANISALAQFLHWHYSLSVLSLALPIGLSFHTFQSLSYIIEVYRGNQRAEKHFGIFALYVMFYPQLVAGPIERPQHLLHQFYEKHRLDLDQFMSGMRLVIWGLFKKVVIADRLSVFVNQIFGNIHYYSGPYFVLAIIFFAFQLYTDFSGYSDMARGLARTLGFELMVNFDAPYFSKSIAEFWRRWHISLSSWLRDYVYYPLVFGIKNANRAKLYLAIMVTFLLSGLWHGAGWNFVLMGGLYGFYISFSQLTKSYREKLLRFLKLDAMPRVLDFFRVVVTFALVCVAWMFFRISSLRDIIYIFGQILANGYKLASLRPYISQAGNSFTVAVVSIIFLLMVDYYLTKKKFSRASVLIQTLAFVALTIVILFIGRFVNAQFIYFQF